MAAHVPMLYLSIKRSTQCSLLQFQMARIALDKTQNKHPIPTRVQVLQFIRLPCVSGIALVFRNTFDNTR